MESAPLSDRYGYSVKLTRHQAVEVIVKAFGYWPIGHADRPLEERLPQNSRHIIVVQQEQKGGLPV
jgi:hypothetical protein